MRGTILLKNSTCIQHIGLLTYQIPTFWGTAQKKTNEKDAKPPNQKPYRGEPSAIAQSASPACRYPISGGDPIRYIQSIR